MIFFKCKKLLMVLVTVFIIMSSCNIDSSKKEDNPSTVDAGDTDNGDTDNGDTDNGDTDNGDTDNGDTDNGDTDNGDTDNGDTDNGNTDFQFKNTWENTTNNRVLHFSFSKTEYSVSYSSGTVITTGTIVKISDTTKESGYFVVRYTRHYAKTLIGYYGVGKWRKLTSNSVEFCEENRDLSTSSDVFNPALYDTAEKAEEELRDFNYQKYYNLTK